MNINKSKIIAIVGPTASGKSDFAVELAKKFDGEIISADSRQVYKGLDIGTGKITKKEMRAVPHYLLDVANPKNKFSVDLYKELADSAIEKITSKAKVPILCGGTGFYVDTVALNLSFPNVPPNPALREKLFQKSSDELYKMLQELDPNRASEIQKGNKVRLIRAIEIAKALGKVPKIKLNPKYETLYIGLACEPEELKERISTRLLKRIKSGMLKEAKDLHARGLSWKRMEELGLEYRFEALYLQNKISKKEMIEKLNTESWHYAKRQMTWFKKNKNIIWLNRGELKEAEKIIKKFLE